MSQVPLTEAILELVKAGLGVSVMARWAIEPAIKTGAVRAVRITRRGVFRAWTAVRSAIASSRSGRRSSSHCCRGRRCPPRWNACDRDWMTLISEGTSEGVRHVTRSDTRTEVIAGITTFFTMSYIVIVNPSILSTTGTGMPFSGVLTATVLVCASMTLLMGLYAKLPFGVAPGMGLNAFFTYTIVLQERRAVAGRARHRVLGRGVVPAGFRDPPARVDRHGDSCIRCGSPPPPASVCCSRSSV